MPRISRDEVFMETARLFALRSTCNRGQVGAVIVRDGRILSTGYNGAPAGQPHCLDVGCLPFRPILGLVPGTGMVHYKVIPEGCARTIHAEANALLYAARVGTPLDAAAMYCTHAMCATCAALVVTAGIVKVVFDKPYRADGLDLLRTMNVEVVRYG